LIWATTTPVRMKGNLSRFEERTDRVTVRNRLAEAVVTKEGIPVDDLFGLVKDHPEYWSSDGVHFNGKGIVVQAAQVANQIMDSCK
jgi:lysophospholipase L1-like esterase